MTQARFGRRHLIVTGLATAAALGAGPATAAASRADDTETIDTETIDTEAGPQPIVGGWLRDLYNAARAREFARIDARNSRSSRFGSYSWTGPYLDYADRPSIAGGSNVKLDDAGVIMVKRGSGYIYNPVTISQYGLQEWSYYRRSGDALHLNRALRQARWLIANQHQASGTWRYDYAFSVGGFDETLEAGWISAMAQGQAMSLLTRLHWHFPNKPGYLHTARRAYRPFVRKVEDGGVRAHFKGRAYYEEYPTRSAPSLALNGFQFSLIGLFDLSRTGFDTATDLFVTGYRTMAFALPYHDAETTTAYHLGHLTKPPRPVHSADHYHRIHVQLLRVLYTIRTSDRVAKYAEKWAAYPPCDADPKRCGR